LARNPRYFLTDRPFLDAVEVLVGLDLATQIMMFERQELDWVYGVPDADFLRLKPRPGHPSAIESVEGNVPYYVSLNCELPPFTDKRVRQALNYAVNKEHLLRVVHHRGVTARGVLPNALKGFNPDSRGYPYDTNKAMTLLRDAGYAGGLALRFVLEADPDNRKIALVVREYLAAVGVQVELQELNSTAWLNEIQRRKQVPIALVTWVANFNDPRDTLDCLVNGERITEEGCVNVAFYSNPKVNALFRQAAPEMDPAKRMQLYRRIEEIVVEDAPWIFLFNWNDCSLRQPWLQGFKMRAVWPQRLESVWLNR
jgi:peptide/nickel transport system substrate-binding protein/oligopeptide transport system substrate-binding protein